MNVYQKIAFATGFIFIGFIIIIALADFNNIITILSFLGALVVISGTVKVLLLSEKRKAVLKELDEFRVSRIKEIRKSIPPETKHKFYCRVCFYQTNSYSKKCPECGKGALSKTGGGN